MEERNNEIENEFESYRIFPKFDVLQIALIGVFSALCYVTLIYKIPLPTVSGSNASVHLGNMLVMLIAVLFNGLTGGVSGSIGMGLYDCLNGYASSSPKTFVLKLGIGLVTGITLYILSRKNKNCFIPLLISTIFFFIIGTVCLTLSIKSDGGKYFVQTTGKSVNMFWATYAFSYVISIFSLISLIISKKMPKNLQYVLVACVFGFIFNLLGEFIYAFIKQLVLGSALQTSFIFALAKMPATIINGTLSIVLVVTLYTPLRRAIPNRVSHGFRK